MCELMFPKGKKKKRRKQHKKSILQEKDGTCYLCRMRGNYRKYPITHKHHVFGGPLRAISEAEGFTVDLCPDDHEFGTEAVHRNQENMRLIQRECQREYEKTHTRQQFMELIGRNYLEDEDV